MTVTHVKGGSSGKARTLRANYAFHRGMARFYHRHYAASRSSFLGAAVYAAIGAKLTVSTARSALTRHVVHRL